MKKKVLIMILGGVVVLGGGGAAAFFLLHDGGKEHAEVEEKVAEPPGVVNLEPFLVNITDTSGDRFAKLTLRLTVSPGKVAHEIDENEVLQAKMRDRVLTLVTSKAVQDLLGPMGKEALRREIKASLSPLLEKGQIEEVLFSDFVVQ